MLSQSKNLLIVDDEKNVLNSLKRVLKDGSWNIATASNGLEALEKMKKSRYEVVISDQ